MVTLAPWVITSKNIITNLTWKILTADADKEATIGILIDRNQTALTAGQQLLLTDGTLAEQRRSFRTGKAISRTAMVVKE